MCDHERSPNLSHHSRRRNWLRVRINAHAQDANQTRSLLSVARSLKESKFQPWTTIAQSGFCSKTEPISDSILIRSFASHPIILTGKLTTTSRSNAGRLCAANNNFPNIKPEPAEKAGFCCVMRSILVLEGRESSAEALGEKLHKRADSRNLEKVG